jgi:hypothetical protein
MVAPGAGAQRGVMGCPLPRRGAAADLGDPGAGRDLSCRLFSQAEAMCKHYKSPVLLIEFDGDKTFGLQVCCASAS